MAQPQTSSYQFFELLFMVASKHWKERYSFGWWHVWCKNSIVLKDLAKIGVLIKCLLAAKFFYSLYTQRFSLPLVILDILFKNISCLLGVLFFCNQQSSYHRPKLKSRWKSNGIVSKPDLDSEKPDF